MTNEEAIKLFKDRDLVGRKIYIDEAIDLAIESLEKVEKLEKENNELKEKLWKKSQTIMQLLDRSLEFVEEIERLSHLKEHTFDEVLDMKMEEDAAELTGWSKNVIKGVFNNDKCTNKH